MGTMVTIHVVRPGAEAAIDQAFDWFQELERRCTRFREESELRQLTSRPGEAVEVSPLLFEAVRFALAVAEESEGAFDPTVGGIMEAQGFREEYRTGQSESSGVSASGVSYRD